MKKAVFLIILFIIHVFLKKEKNMDDKTLLVSFFFMSVPFQFAVPLYQAKVLSNGGTLGTLVAITLPMLFLAFFAASSKYRLLKSFKWGGPNFYILLTLFIIALFNPYNAAPIASIIYVLFVSSNLLCFVYFIQNFTLKQVTHGMYTALSVLSYVQLILAICFPVLHIQWVTTLFFDDAAGWSTRMGQRDGAVGVFNAPGDLALFCTLACTFFLASRLNKFKVKSSNILIWVNVVTIFLTYSRTSYLTIIFVLFFSWFLFNRAKTNLFSIRNILVFGIPISLLMVWVVDFSPLSSLFLDSNVQDMYTARLMHWAMAFEVFQNHPIIGVGLNAHLEYFNKQSELLKTVDLNNDFLIKNPVHNIHMIVLAETGTIGMIFWASLIIRSIKNGKKFISLYKPDIDFTGQLILVLSAVSITVVYVIYGITGWAPFSQGLFPYFLFFMFYSFYFYRKYLEGKPV